MRMVRSFRALYRRDDVAFAGMARLVHADARAAEKVGGNKDIYTDAQAGGASISHVACAVQPSPFR
jgi:hypothetical protein